MRSHTVGRGMKQRQKGIPSFTVMAGVVARVPSHFTVAARRSRPTGRHGWAFSRREREARGPLIRGTHTAHLYVTRPHPEVGLTQSVLRYYRTPARFETPQISRARQTIALLLDTKNGRNRREETGRERIARRRGAGRH